mmetsp:Transcript_7492/g.25774  ORF Transcript_7492/g.25774 Transcript_7492/m.25774 type:complete len:292 (-) Transcript_7492:247-1122(-)
MNMKRKQTGLSLCPHPPHRPPSFLACGVAPASAFGRVPVGSRRRSLDGGPVRRLHRDLSSLDTKGVRHEAGHPALHAQGLADVAPDRGAQPLGELLGGLGSLEEDDVPRGGAGRGHQSSDHDAVHPISALGLRGQDHGLARGARQLRLLQVGHAHHELALQVLDLDVLLQTRNHLLRLAVPDVELADVELLGVRVALHAGHHGDLEEDLAEVLDRRGTPGGGGLGLAPRLLLPGARGGCLRRGRVSGLHHGLQHPPKVGVVLHECLGHRALGLERLRHQVPGLRAALLHNV